MKIACVFHVVQHGIEHSIDKLPALFRAEEFRKFDRFVHGNLGGDFIKIHELADCHTQNKSVENGDAQEFGGSGVGNLGGVTAEETAWHGQPCSAVVTLPPLAVVAFAAKP